MHKIQTAILNLLDQRSLNDLSLRQIGELINVEHPQKVSHHLTQLQKKGLIKFDKHQGLLERISMGKKRTDDLISIPILGAANCGPAELYADQNVEGCLQVSPRILSKRKHVFAIRAEGNSMNKADVNGKSIESGDFVVIDGSRRFPNTGEYVLSVCNGVANIKKFIHEKTDQQIVLVSESNQTFPPIYIHEQDFSDFMINGVVVQVIKKPRY